MNKLMDHNGLHRLLLVKQSADLMDEVKFDRVVEGVLQESYKCGPGPVGADIGNIVIKDVQTDAGNPDYFKFDPESKLLCCTQISEAEFCNSR